MARSPQSESRSVRPHCISRKKKALFIAVIWSLLFGVTYFGSLVYRSYGPYKTLKTPSRGWKTPLHEPDRQLGSKPIANLRSAQLFPIGPEQELRHDKYGFRVPLDEEVPLSDGPLVMCFGCSHTYGDGVFAKETYSYLLGQALGGRSINAGACGWGLTQMLVRAQDVVPKFKPDYIVVQYSTWLTERATRLMAPAQFWKMPVPYFTDVEGELAIAKPVFTYRPERFSHYRTSPNTCGDAIHFFLNAAGPSFVHDDLNMMNYMFRRMANLLPSPVRDKRRIETYVFQQFAKLARDNDAKLVIAVLGLGRSPVSLDPIVIPEGSLVVRAHDAMIERLSPDPFDYRWKFGIVRGNPPQVIDRSHPGPRAHAVIAAELASAIRDSESH